MACYAKNAADEKLKHYLHRFAQTYPSPSTAVVLSGDVNFGPVISNLTGFYTLNTVLIHNLQCSTNLKQAAKIAILFDEFIQGIGLLLPFYTSILSLKGRELLQNQVKFEIQ